MLQKVFIYHEMTLFSFISLYVPLISFVISAWLGRRTQWATLLLKFSLKDDFAQNCCFYFAACCLHAD
jgi:hypothetical protein